MRLSILIILLSLLSGFLFAEGNQEYVVTDTLLVDDFEDNNFISALNNKWDFFSVSESNMFTIEQFSPLVKPGAEGSAYALHEILSVSGDIKFHGVSINLHKNETPMDLSDYYGIRFYAKGSGSFDLKLEMIPAKMSNEYNHRRYQITLTDKWTLYEVPFSKFRHPGYGASYKFSKSEIYGIEWGLDKYRHSRKCDLYLDSVEFFKADIVVKTDTKESTIKEEIADKDSAGKKDSSGTLTDNNRQIEKFKDRRLAVVGIESKEIDDSLSKAIVDFIINAFVNEGTMKVVDRNSIEKILSEQEFQTMDFTDTSKVIKIGKLAGAEYIVFGSLSKVAEVFYLNIKLISVETAEITGSSISTAKDASGFFEMCNTGVADLFD
ncbi:MAG: hypothetical protein JXJ04_14600 [Spirochaetales bacterium]|nr:hypothetical protein [Spirochaetales bacterium]